MEPNSGLTMIRTKPQRALLVYPRFPSTYWGFQHALPLFGRKAMHSPLSLVTVAALLPQDWEFKLVDLNVEPLTDEHIRWADLVFLTAMSVQGPSLYEVLERCKALGRTTVLGGPFASGDTEKVEGRADVLVLDEGEITIPMYLADLAAGTVKPKYRTDRKPDITTSPVPRYDLLELSAYSVIDVQYSRGCPFNCEFCDIIELYGRVPRTKTPEQLLAEFDALLALGYKGAIFLVDDNFIGNKKNVRVLMQHLIPWMKKHDYPFFLGTEASVNLADDAQLLTDMRAAGFKRVFMGIETPSMEGLKETQKYQNTRGDLVKSVHTVIESGLEVSAGFIVGFDSDTPDIFERQIAFIEKAEIPWAMVGTLSAIPGTQLWRRLEKEGRLFGKDFRDHFGHPNFRTVMDPHVLHRGYMRILETLYEPRNYFDRLVAMIDRQQRQRYPNLHENSYSTAKIAYLAVTATIMVGLVSNARWAYWRALAQVLWRFPHKIAQFLISAIIGYHFIRFTREVMERREEIAAAPAHSARLSTPISITK